MVLQSPAKPAGLIGVRVILAVGIWYVTLSWRSLPVVKSARGVVAGALAGGVYMQAMIARLVEVETETHFLETCFRCHDQKTETRFCFHIWYRTVGGRTVA